MHVPETGSWKKGKGEEDEGRNDRWEANITPKGKEAATQTIKSVLFTSGQADWQNKPQAQRKRRDRKNMQAAIADSLPKHEVLKRKIRLERQLSG